MNDKAVLAMDMQECCDTCVFSSTAHGSELFEEGECYCILKIKSVDDIVEGYKPDWCPLKPVPEKKEEMWMPRTPSMNDFKRIGFQKGWNACIDKILEGCKNG